MKTLMIDIVAIQLLCQTTFMPCNPLLPLPSFACKEKCLQTKEICKSFISEMGSMLSFDCNQKEATTMQDTWPSNRTIFSIL